MLNKQFMKSISQVNFKCSEFFPPAPVHSSHLLKTSQAEYQEVKNELVAKLEQKAESYMFTGKSSINPLPVLMSKSHIAQYKSIQEALSFAIQTMVTNYFYDERIQKAFRLCPQVKNILEMHREKPYESIGSFRPDILNEKKTHIPKFCEINARFTTNGYLLTQFGCQAIDEINGLKNKRIKRIENLSNVVKAYENFFELDMPIGILIGREKISINDMQILQKILPNAFYIKPSELKLDSSSNLYVTNTDSNKIILSQFLIELHQDEITSLPVEIVRSLVTSCKILNDLRTVFLVHNKSFLTLLSDDSFLKDYLSPFYHDVIKTHRIMSLRIEKLTEDLTIYNRVINEKNNWLVKPCRFGKGEGIIFGKNVSTKSWEDILKKCIESNDYIVQEYVRQEMFQITHDEEGLVSSKDYYLVGSILCFNEKFLGPGIFRSSTKDLIAIKQGGFLIYPVEGHLESEDFYEKLSNFYQAPNLYNNFKNHEILFDYKYLLSNEIKKPIFPNHKPFQIPNNATFHLDKFCFSKVQLYEDALLEHGFVIIQCGFKDGKSTFFKSLINHFGIPQNHNSNNDNFLWHIRDQKVGDDTDLARSHGKKLFPIHTDASFEHNPPRYFALQVQKSDRYNGGQSLMVSLNEIIDNLSDEDISVLRNEKIQFKIPLEFIKTNAKTNSGRILSRGTDKLGNILCRYRQDIIHNQSELPSNVTRALDKLNQLIDVEESKIIKYFNLNDNDIFIVDNTRWLHGRTEVNDKDRHLVRIRFQTKFEELMPIF